MHFFYFCSTLERMKKLQSETKKIKGKIKPFDFIAFFLVIFLAVYLMYLSSKPSSSYLKVTVNEETYRYSLKENGIREIMGPLGITKIQIENGRARIIESPCPNQTCVHQGWGKTLVCLPNKVIATVEGFSQEEELDAVSR